MDILWQELTAGLPDAGQLLHVLVRLMAAMLMGAIVGMQRRGFTMNVQGSIEFTVTERSEDRVVSEMPIRPGTRNPFGVVHAGAMLWLADVTASLLVMGPGEATEGMKGFPLAISLNANFLGNQTEGALKAVASFVKRGRTVSVVRTTVYGAGGKLIADVTTSHVLSK